MENKNGELVLTSIMGSFGRPPEGIDLKCLSPEEAGAYLWHRFVSNLQ